MIEMYGETFFTLGRAVLLAFAGVVIGFLLKFYLRRLIDKGILKKTIKDGSLYDTSSLFNKIFTSLLQWLIILIFLDRAFLILGYNFFSGALTYLVQNGSAIVGFILISGAGILLSKIISSVIKKRDIDHKWEIVTIAEIIIVSAFILTAFEFIGIKATALIELYKVILYIMGALILILIINPKMLQQQTKPKKS